MQYLTPAEIFYLHSRLISETGGKADLRDWKILKKVVSYMKNSEVFPDIFSKAGALFFAISKKKPFSSKNTATSLFATSLFLKINGRTLRTKESDMENFIKNHLATSPVGKISQFLADNSN
ncbi:hypothetical protein HYV44_02060 [Candidatus Microgenomates bacterium]|nr:hypothetical protein [Candidatus Microgenomates bacterium]